LQPNRPAHRRLRVDKRKAAEPYVYKLPEARLERKRQKKEVLKEDDVRRYIKQSMSAYLQNVIESTVKSTAKRSLEKALKQLKDKLCTSGKSLLDF
jgi:hypothetical protein